MRNIQNVDREIAQAVKERDRAIQKLNNLTKERSEMVRAILGNKIYIEV